MAGVSWGQILIGIFILAVGAWMFYENIKGTRYTWTFIFIPIPFSFWGPIALIVFGGLMAVGKVPLPT